MNDEKFVQIFGGIDEKYIREANEDMNFWLESQEGEVVRADGSRRFPWRTVIASVACTAAALFGVFVLMLNVGKIRVIDSPESSVNSPAQIGATPALPDDAVLYDEAAYAYEGESSVLKRYAVGDKFGENTVIKSAKATYKIVDGKPVLQKQEIVLDGELEYKSEMGEWIGEARDEHNNLLWIDIDIEGAAELILPRFGDGFKIMEISGAISGEWSDLPFFPVNATMIDPTITVNYEIKSIRIEPDKMFYSNDDNTEKVDVLMITVMPEEYYAEQSELYGSESSVMGEYRDLSESIQTEKQEE